jgi:hypothetical protein
VNHSVGAGKIELSTDSIEVSATCGSRSIIISTIPRPTRSRIGLKAPIAFDSILPPLHQNLWATPSAAAADARANLLVSRHVFIGHVKSWEIALSETTFILQYLHYFGIVSPGESPFQTGAAVQSDAAQTEVRSPIESSP